MCEKIQKDLNLKELEQPLCEYDFSWHCQKYFLMLVNQEICRDPEHSWPTTESSSVVVARVDWRELVKNSSSEQSVPGEWNQYIRGYCIQLCTSMLSSNEYMLTLKGFSNKVKVKVNHNLRCDLWQVTSHFKHQLDFRRKWRIISSNYYSWVLLLKSHLAAVSWMSWENWLSTLRFYKFI